MTVSAITLTIDGETVTCPDGTALSHLLTGRGAALRRSPRQGAPRGMYCGMGLCFECAVQVDGLPRRACMLRAADGMVVTTGTRDPEAGS